MTKAGSSTSFSITGILFIKQDSEVEKNGEYKGYCLMDIRVNEWSKLLFKDPAILLPELRKIQEQLASSNLDDKIKNLRTHKLKSYREGWEAALFCYGMGKKLGIPVYFAIYEKSDYDAVAKRYEGETEYYTPIQIKEVVPDSLNPVTDINQVIAKLTKYPTSTETVVMIHVNRIKRQFDLQSIIVPKLNIAGLWLLGGLSPDQSRWFIYGNLLDNPQGIEFDHPV